MDSYRFSASRLLARFHALASAWLRCALPSCLAIMIGSPATSSALNIVLQEAPVGTTLNPVYDPGLNELGDIMQAAADYWESIILDNHQVTVTYGYVDLPPAQHGLAQVTANDGLRATTGNVAFDIETNSFGDWYFDQTPTNHSEFAMQQVLHRDLSPAAQGLYYTGSPPDVLEVGYWGNYVGADQGRDALTTAVHELGHLLGLAQALPNFAGQIGDGDYDFNIFYTQLTPTAVRYAGPGGNERDHVRASDATMAIGAGNGDRNLPGATDVFALASVSGWSLIDLPRKDFWGNGATNWNNTLNWPGNRAPDAADEVFVRNGSDANLTTGNGFAGNLFIQEDSSVSTGGNRLDVTNKITIEGVDPGGQASLVIDASGRVVANEIELNDGGFLALTNSQVIEVDVNEVDINEGGVLLGNGSVQFANVLRNDGTITAIAGASNELSLLTGNVDLDGFTGNGRIFAVLGDLRVSANVSDGFDGEMTIGAGRYVTIFGGWNLGGVATAGGTINLEGTASNPATLNSPTSSATFVKGQINVSGVAVITGTTNFESQTSTTFATNAQLTTEGLVRLRGASFMGQGTLQFNGPVVTEQSTILSNAVVDLDGLQGTTSHLLDNAALILNVDRVEMALNNRFDGSLELSGTAASLEVNLNDPVDSWQMDGTLTTTGLASLISYQQTLVGSPVHVSGTLAISGLAEITAPMDLSGDVTLANIFTSLRLSGGPHVIRDTATLSGSGRLRVGPTGSVFLADGAVIGVDLSNQGHLDIGATMGQIGLATIDGDYSQTGGLSALRIELAGGPLSGDYDALDVNGTASVGGELIVTPIDGFIPHVGDVFNVVTANSVGGMFDTVTLGDGGALQFEANVTYPGTRVRVQITDVSLLGDFDDNFVLNCADIDALVSEVATGGSGAAFDLNGDSLVDFADVALWLEGAGVWNTGAAFAEGDANLDGLVNIDDFDVWNGNRFMANVGWCGGDFNADGVADVSDFHVWNQNKDNAAVSAAVPEPSMHIMFLVVIGLLAHVKLRRPTN